MASKEIYNNGNSKCSVEFDGEIISLIQETDGFEPHTIFLYLDEFEKAYQFVQIKKFESKEPVD